MRSDFSCCSLDGVQKGARTKVYPKHRYHKMACSMVFSKSLLMNVVKTFPIDKPLPRWGLLLFALSSLLSLSTCTSCMCWVLVSNQHHFWKCQLIDWHHRNLIKAVMTAKPCMPSCIFHLCLASCLVFLLYSVVVVIWLPSEADVGTETNFELNRYHF